MIQRYTEIRYYVRCDVCQVAVHPEYIGDLTHSMTVAEARAERVGWLIVGRGLENTREHACPTCARSKGQASSAPVGSQQAQT